MATLLVIAGSYGTGDDGPIVVAVLPDRCPSIECIPEPDPPRWQDWLLDDMRIIFAIRAEQRFFPPPSPKIRRPDLLPFWTSGFV